MTIQEVQWWLNRRNKNINELLFSFGSINRFDTSLRLVDAVELARVHHLDTTHLTRGLEQESRDVIPRLYLALGRDQEAYDYMK